MFVDCGLQSAFTAWPELDEAMRVMVLNLALEIR